MLNRSETHLESVSSIISSEKDLPQNEISVPELPYDQALVFAGHMYKGTQSILNPTDAEKKIPRTSEDITEDLLKDDTKYIETAARILENQYSDGVTNRVIQTAKHIIKNAAELHKKQKDVPDLQIRINQDTLNLSIIYAWDLISNEDPEFETPRVYTGKTRGNQAPEEELKIEISRFVPGTTGRLENMLVRNSKITIDKKGRKVVEHLDEVINDEWNYIRITSENGRQIDMYIPQSSLEGTDSEFLPLIEHIAGVSRDIEYFVSDNVDKTEPAVYYAFNSRRYVPRPSAIPNETIAFIHLEYLKSALHERVHTEMNARYGRNFVGIMTEGASTYIEHKLLPNLASGEALRPYNQQEILKIICERVPAEQVTWVAEDIINKANVSLDTEPEEFVYPYARLFAEYFVDRYGKDKYFQLYGLTSTKNGTLLDTKTGETLVIMGGKKLGVSEDQILEAALLNLGIDPEFVKKDLYSYIRTLDGKELIKTAKAKWTKTLTNN